MQSSIGPFPTHHICFYIANVHCHAASFLAFPHYQKLEVHLVGITVFSSVQDPETLCFPRWIARVSDSVSDLMSFIAPGPSQAL